MAQDLFLAFFGTGYMTFKFTESIFEDATLAWLDGLGYTVANGPDLALGELFSERVEYVALSEWN